MVDEDLTNFPVLISFIDGDLIGKTQPDGDDLLFTDFYSIKLNHEIEYYNSSNGELYAWVNVTTLSSTIDTILYMYYGNLVCGSQENPTGVWHTDYRMVQHFEETSGVTSDSTIYGHDGLVNSVHQDAVGLIDGADEFVYSDPSYSRGPYFDVNNEYSVGLWFNADTFSNPEGNWQCMFEMGGTTSERIIFYLLNDEFGAVGHRTVGYTASSDADLSTGEWYYAVFTFNYSASPQAHMYSNGVDLTLTHNNDLGQTPSLHDKYNIGANRVSDYAFDGRIDDLWFTDRVCSPDWVNTSYKSQSNPESFYDVGSEEIWNQPPGAIFMFEPVNPTIDDIVYFNSTSYDPDGYIVNWTWDFGDGNMSYGEQVTHSYEDDGIYNVTLTVLDNDLASNTTYILITVEKIDIGIIDAGIHDGDTRYIGSDTLNVTVKNLGTITTSVMVNLTLEWWNTTASDWEEVDSGSMGPYDLDPDVWVESFFDVYYDFEGEYRATFSLDTPLYTGWNDNDSSNDNHIAEFDILTEIKEINISLKTGWNLISVPVDNDFTAITLSENITGCVMISRFDAVAQTYETYIVGGPPSFDFPIIDGHGYFILVDENSTLSVSGLPITSVSVGLSIGWNMIGWYHGHDTMASSICENITGSVMISWFDVVNNMFNTYIVGGPPSFDFTVGQGMGLFVLVDTASTWQGEG